MLLSNAFGSLIASGILDGMEGRFGYAAWRYEDLHAPISPNYSRPIPLRWLFFIEGSLTVFVAICAIFILPDFPETSYGWLTPTEQSLAQRRMMEDAGADDQGSTSGHMAGFMMAVTDWKVWWLALGLTSMVVSLSFNAYFPTLSATMGYDRTMTLLLCAPPWIFATFIALGVSRCGWFFRSVIIRYKTLTELLDILISLESDVGILPSLCASVSLDLSSLCPQ